MVRALRLAVGGWRGLGGLLGLLWHHHRAQLGIGCQHAMETDQVQARPGHQGSQPLYELQRRHHQVRGAVAPGRLERQHDLSGGVALHTFNGQGRAGDVAAQLLQSLAVFGAAAHGHMQAETLHVSAQRLVEVCLPGQCALQREHLLPGPRAKGITVSADADAFGRRLCGVESY